MSNQTKVTGVILAGGLARRMNRQDKGLITFRGKPLISYAIAAISPLVETVIINANRNHEHYQKFDCPVISDQTETFDGPLAGVLTAILACQTEVLLVMPCDSPLIKTDHLEQILQAREDAKADVAVAFDGQRLHPVFLALSVDLKDSLNNYLISGERKIDKWLAQHQMVKADFSASPEIFANINTLEELSDLEKVDHD
jgi:molybdopterin-guanine dinucleotide biosynthesis protein A